MLCEAIRQLGRQAMIHSDPSQIHLPEGLSAKLGKPLRFPPEFTPSVGVADPAHMFVRMVPEDSIKLDGLVVGIIYSDSKGDASTRMVRLDKMWRNEDHVHLTAYCMLRNALRQFRLDRIQTVIDAETGELLGDGPSYFEEMIPNCPSPNRLQAWNEVKDGIRVLSAFATIDGKLYKNEVSTIVHYAKSRCKKHDYALTAKEEKTIAKLIQAMHPSEECAKEALLRVRKNRDHVLDLLNAIKATCLADGTLCDEEIAFMSILGITFYPSQTDRLRQN